MGCVSSAFLRAGKSYEGSAGTAGSTEIQGVMSAAGFGTVGQGRLIEVSRVTVWRWVQQAVLRATEGVQLPRGRKCWDPHTLRHSFARHTLLNGIPLSYLSQWLGHGRIQTILVYLKLASDPLGSLASVP